MSNENLFAGRLLRLADKLESLPPERFRFDSYVGRSWGGAKDLSCGTTACGLGWATAMPEFQALGLALFRLDGEYDAPYPGLDGDRLAGQYDGTINACREIFGLSPSEVDRLFIPSDGDTCHICGEADDDQDECGHFLPAVATAKDLAGHIRRFVAEKWGST